MFCTFWLDFQFVLILRKHYIRWAYISSLGKVPFCTRQLDHIGIGKSTKVGLDNRRIKRWVSVTLICSTERILRDWAATLVKYDSCVGRTRLVFHFERVGWTSTFVLLLQKHHNRWVYKSSLGTVPFLTRQLDCVVEYCIARKDNNRWVSPY